MSKILILHAPVPHAGAIQFIEKHLPDKVLVLGNKYLSLLEYLGRDARALKPTQVVAALRGIFSSESKYFKSDQIRVLGEDIDVVSFRVNDTFVMPDEDITRAFAEKYLPVRDITWDTSFLRWNMQNVTKEFPADPDEEISCDEMDRRMIGEAMQIATRSPDWWRQVGVVAAIGSDVVVALSNTHSVSVYSAYIDGDPRTPFRPGERIDVSLAEHAESRLVAYFARVSMPLSECRVYVTTFPCPTCARLLVSAGIKELYYSEGYSLVNAREVFRSHNVKVIRVKM